MKSGYMVLIGILIIVVLIAGCTTGSKPSLSSNVTVSSLMVYKVDKPVIDQSYIKHLTNQLGFNGKIYSDNDPFGQLEIADDNHNGLTIFREGGFSYMSAGVISQSKPSNLPTKDQAILIANKFLMNNNISFDPGSVSVTPVYEPVYDSHNNTWINGYVTYWAIGYDTILNGYKIVGLGAGVGISIGDNGGILDVNYRYKNVTPYKVMSLKSSEKAYSDLMNGTYIKIDRMKSINDEAITDVSFGYYMDLGYINQSYIQPVYVFKGNDFTAYVSALANDSELT